MSAYLTLPTPMIDTECLVSALVDVGFARSAIEVHTVPRPLVGFEGSSRGQTAEVIIRRQHVGASSNDLGFRRTPTGFQALVSDYDQGRYGPQWLQRVHERYETHDQVRRARLAEEERRRVEEERRLLVESQRTAVLERAKKLDYSVKESREGGKLRIVLVRRSY